MTKDLIDKRPNGQNLIDKRLNWTRDLMQWTKDLIGQNT